jgi:hypothetical protein
MGSGAHNPLLLITGGDRGNSSALLDVKNFRPLNYQLKESRPIDLDPDHLRVSTDGKVFASWRAGTSPQGITSMVITGQEIRGYYEHESVGHILPGPDGRVLFTGRGLHTKEGKGIGDVGNRGFFTLPAAHGLYSLTLKIGDQAGPGKKYQLTLHIGTDPKPLVTLSNVEVPDGFSQWGREKMGGDKRLFLIPAAKLLITIPNDGERLVLYRCDPEDMLAKSGIDYLYVASQPPSVAKVLTVFSYKIEVKSKKGGVKFKLENGPPGMTVTPEGLVRWTPGATAPPSVDAIVSVKDGSGQEVLHTFTLRTSR